MEALDKSEMELFFYEDINGFLRKAITVDKIVNRDFLKTYKGFHKIDFEDAVLFKDYQLD